MYSISYFSTMTYNAYKIGNKLFGNGKKAELQSSSQESQLQKDSSPDLPLVLDRHGRRREDDLVEGEGRLDNRLDFVLGMSTIEKKFGTGFIMSHVSYWEHQDVARFVRSKLEDCEGAGRRAEKKQGLMKRVLKKIKTKSNTSWPKVSSGIVNTDDDQNADFISARCHSLPDLRTPSNEATENTSSDNLAVYMRSKLSKSASEDHLSCCSDIKNFRELS